jgi:hypothetical protein
MDVGTYKIFVKIRAAYPAPFDRYEDLVIGRNRCGNLHDTDVALRVELCRPHFLWCNDEDEWR